MARPTKQGLDYFPMDVETDDKIEIIEARHGLLAFAVVIKLFQRIYKQGYFCQWNEDFSYTFSRRIGVEKEFVDKVLIDCLNYGIFNRDKYEKYSVLTSRGIQKRYKFAIGRRIGIDINDDIMITETSLMSTETELIHSETPQIKEKKIKENKSKEELIEARKIEFENLVYETDPLKYSKEMLEAFVNYWTEANRSNTKMKFELQQAFEIRKRLATWARNEKEFDRSFTKKKPVEEMISYDDLVRRFNSGETDIWDKYEVINIPGKRKPMWKLKKNE